MPKTTSDSAPTFTFQLGDALIALAGLPTNAVDAVVTDPPYAIKRLPASTFERLGTRQPECTRTGCTDIDVCHDCTRMSESAKFADTPMLGQQSQNWHAKATHSRGYADNDPRQFQRWCVLWLTECLRVLKPGGHLVAFGGTKTWHRLAVAAEESGFEIRDSLAWIYSSGMPKSLDVRRAVATSRHDIDDRLWDGWGTGLKPAFEPIVLARKPLVGTMADNIATWGVGPLNLTRQTGHEIDDRDAATQSARKWPTNLHLDDNQAEAASNGRGQDADRFFWVAKPNRSERVVVDGIAHPTVKPLDLMRRLVRLVTPPGGLVLDPFAGSGTTVEACLLEGMNVTAFEREPTYAPLVEHRVARATQATQTPFVPVGASSDGRLF